jgi:iron complex outermembrane recepter protein
MFSDRWWKKRVHSSIQHASVKRSPEVDEGAFFRTVVFVLLLILSSSLMAGSDYTESVLFDIPRQRADLSLIQFAEQADLTLIFPINEVEGKITNQLVGQYSIEEAIKNLLLGTGLDGAMGDEGQLSIASSQKPGGVKKIMKKQRKLSLLSKVALFVFGAVNALGVSAQEDADDEKGSVLEELIVTGTSAKGRTALETSYGIAILNEEAISKHAAIGTADLVDAIPSIYGEGYGGETNTGINARGIRENWNTYISLQEDGLPLLYTPFFSEQEIRPDATYDRIEAVLGGPSGIFTAQGSSATINFISREAPEEQEGDIAFSVTDYGTFRTDFFVGGPLTDKWSATAGGFYRKGEGVRDNGYDGDEGGQFRASLRRTLGDADQGSATLRIKLINDNTIFYTPQPVDFSSGTPKAIPGLDPRKESIIGPDVLILNNKTPDGVVPIELRPGEGENTTQISLKLEWEFDNGFRISNHSRYAEITNDTHDIRGGGSNSIFRASEFKTANDAAVLAYFPTAVDTRFVRVSDGRVLSAAEQATWNGNGLMTRQNVLRYVKEHTNFINDFQLNYSDDRLAATAGFQFWDMESWTHYTQADFLTDVRGQASRFDLEAFDATGATVGHLTDGGVLTHGGFDNQGTWDVESRNLYFNVEYQVMDDLRLDAGVRYENVTFDVTGHDVGFGVPLPAALNDPLVMADDVASIVGNGDVYTGSTNPEEVTWTVGGSYTIMDDLAVYARYTSAHDFGTNGLDFAYFNIPGFGVPGGSNLLAAEEATRLKFGEVGLRYASPKLSFFATAFSTENIDVSRLIRDVNTGVLSQTVVDVEAYGVEFQGTWRPMEMFSLDMSGVVQNSEVKDPTPGSTADGLKQNRLPEVQLRGALNYFFEKGSAYLSMTHWGRRPANFDNTIWLPADTSLDAGLYYDVNDWITVSLQGKNLTDETLPQTGALNDNAGDTLTPEFLYAGHMPGRRFNFTVKFSY